MELVLDPPPRPESPPELESTCPYFDLQVNVKGHLLASVGVRGMKSWFVVDTGANLCQMTHATAKTLGLVDDITKYHTVNVEYIDRQQAVQFGLLPAV